MKIIMMSCVALLLASRPVAAQQHLTPAGLNGEWTGTLVLDNSSPRIALVFDAKDSSSFAGKVYADGDSLGTMEQGTIAGDRVHFTVGRFDFTGTVTGSRMKIDLIVFNGSTRTFIVTKTPEPPLDSADPAVHRTEESPGASTPELSPDLAVDRSSTRLPHYRPQ